MTAISDTKRETLIRFAQTLIDQRKAKIIVKPLQDKAGFWFGGGNMVESENGSIYLCGRYRNHGDSRTGLQAGERGVECVVFRSEDRGVHFEKVLSLEKKDLTSDEGNVISIEGTSLHLTQDGVELFVSTEKEILYPKHLRKFQKPGAGVWTIDVLKAPTIEELSTAAVKPLLSSNDARFLHVKDPVSFDMENGDTGLFFCTHPYNWASSNSAYVERKKGQTEFEIPDFHIFPRGFTWDVAISRITSVMQVPRIGVFAEMPPLSLLFYDGGECVRNLDEHKQAVTRPRGYSCEELGGLAVSESIDFRTADRLSVELPLFLSPFGTGSSRYVEVLSMKEGFLAVWQQSQENKSQPLVRNFVSMQEAESLLR
jgi:hypothetical protein